MRFYRCWINFCALSVTLTCCSVDDNRRPQERQESNTGESLGSPRTLEQSGAIRHSDDNVRQDPSAAKGRHHPDTDIASKSVPEVSTPRSLEEGVQPKAGVSNKSLQKTKPADNLRSDRRLSWMLDRVELWSAICKGTLQEVTAARSRCFEPGWSQLVQVDERVRVRNLYVASAPEAWKNGRIAAVCIDRQSEAEKALRNYVESIVWLRPFAAERAEEEISRLRKATGKKLESLGISENCPYWIAVQAEIEERSAVLREQGPASILQEAYVRGMANLKFSPLGPESRIDFEALRRLSDIYTSGASILDLPSEQLRELEIQLTDSRAVTVFSVAEQYKMQEVVDAASSLYVSANIQAMLAIFEYREWDTGSEDEKREKSSALFEFEKHAR